MRSIRSKIYKAQLPSVAKQVFTFPVNNYSRKFDPMIWSDLPSLQKCLWLKLIGIQVFKIWKLQNQIQNHCRNKKTLRGRGRNMFPMLWKGENQSDDVWWMTFALEVWLIFKMLRDSSQFIVRPPCDRNVLDWSHPVSTKLELHQNGNS